MRLYNPCQICDQLRKQTQAQKFMIAEVVWATEQHYRGLAKPGPDMRYEIAGLLPAGKQRQQPPEPTVNILHVDFGGVMPDPHGAYASIVAYIMALPGPKPTRRHLRHGERLDHRKFDYLLPAKVG